MDLWNLLHMINFAGKMMSIGCLSSVLELLLFIILRSLLANLLVYICIHFCERQNDSGDIKLILICLDILE